MLQTYLLSSHWPACIPQGSTTGSPTLTKILQRLLQRNISYTYNPQTITTQINRARLRLHSDLLPTNPITTEFLPSSLLLALVVKPILAKRHPTPTTSHAVLPAADYPILILTNTSGLDTEPDANSAMSSLDQEIQSITSGVHSLVSSINIIYVISCL